MDLRCVYVTLLYIYVYSLCFNVPVALSIDINSTQAPTTVEQTDSDESEEDKIFGNPFWLGFTVILFICLVVLALIVSLTFGIYKFRQNAKRQGLYKDKRRIYAEDEENTGPDYSIFTTERNSESDEVNNATYVGSS